MEDNMLKRNLLYKATSILLAVLLWFFVTDMQNPVIDKTLSVAVSYESLNEGLITGDRLQKIELKVKGPSSVITALQAKDIKSSVDLSKAVIGSNTFPVQVILPAGIELVSIKPASIDIHVDAIQEKQLSIYVKQENIVAQGYSSFEPVLTPSRLVVRGAKHLLDELDSARVTVDLNQATKNLMLNLPVSLLDKNGNLVSIQALDINPKNVQVFVPVIQNSPTITVPIKPVLVGKTKENFQVSRVILEPETIKISGSYELLKKINHINTENIEISGLNENLVTQVSLLAPEGVSLLYEPLVKVLVQIEEAPIDKEFVNIPIIMENQKSGTAVSLKDKSVDVTVQGSGGAIRELKESDIKAILDLTDLNTGSHQVEIKIGIPNGIQVLRVEPSTVELKIESNS